MYTGTSAENGLVFLKASYTAAGSELYTIAATDRQTDTSAIHQISFIVLLSLYTILSYKKHVKYLKKI